MALINCPDCGTEVSDKAEKCIKCAYPINKSKSTNISNNASNHTNVTVKPSQGCFLQTLNTGCIITAIIIIIIFLMINSCV